MPEYDPPDLSAARVEAANALLTSLREVRDVLDRLQLAAAWVLDVYGDPADAETVRMLRIPGGPVRPGKPAVPPATSRHLTDDLDDDRKRDLRAGLAAIDTALRFGHEYGLLPDDEPYSVTGDEAGSDQ